MYLEDCVKKMIHEYPLLYKDRDYQKSRLKVLEHIFFVLGNGFEFSTCREYFILHPQYKDEEDDWARLPDAPYGQEVYEGLELNQAYFDTPIYRDRSDDIEKLIEDGVIGKEFRLENASYNEWSPYPLCVYAKLVCLLNEDHNMQQDWIDGCSDVAKEALRFYDTPERFHKDSYFPSPRNLRLTLQNFERTEDASGLRKTWKYKDGESILAHSVKMWISFHAKTVRDISLYLCKFGTPVAPLPRTPSYQELYDEIHGYLFAPNGVELFEMIGKSSDSWFQGKSIISQDELEQLRDKVTKVA